jgi:ABC-type antimicrobial peptide transport system permease subunit
VGVKDSKQRDLKGRIERRFYIPLLQTSDTDGPLRHQNEHDAQSLIPAIRGACGMGSLRTVSVDTARNLMSQTLSSERSLARFSGLFALVALALAVAGLYGLTSYAIARRTNEIGIRMALGASRVAVIGMVIRGTLGLMAIGFAVGVPTALAATRLIGANVAGVKATDPANLLRVVSLMIAVGVAAVCIPAVRASRVDPVSALRID